MSNPPLKCECEKPAKFLWKNGNCGRCNRPIQPTTEPKCNCPRLNGAPQGMSHHPMCPMSPEPKCCETAWCCEKCTGYKKANGIGQAGECKNASCICHTPPVEGEWEKEFETRFNQKYGFGIWDSRATDKETMLRTHRDEGVWSSDVLEFCKSFITTLLHSERERVAKAFGGCTKCYGKGYATVMIGEQGFEDFGGEGYIELPTIKMRFCSCDRGKQLEKLLPPR